MCREGTRLPLESEGPKTVQTRHAHEYPGCPVFPKADICAQPGYDRGAATDMHVLLSDFDYLAKVISYCAQVV